MADVKKTVSKNIRKYRLKRGLSQDKLSQLTKIAKSDLSKMENNPLNLTLDRLALLAKHLEISLPELISDGKKQNSNKKLLDAADQIKELSTYLRKQLE